MVIQTEMMAAPPIPHIQNQLRFNLHRSTSPSNLAVRFRKPGPVIVERLGSSPTRRHPDFVEHAPPSVQFSVISEESLSMAVKLAKRDIKKKKMDLELEKLRKEQEQAVSGRAKKTKIVPSKQYLVKAQQRQDRRRAGKTVQSVETQADIKPKKKRPTSKTQATNRQTNVELHYPPTTDSPPTRDIDNYQVTKSEDEKNIDEICQIRHELNDCVEKIYQVERRVLAKRGEPPQFSEEERLLEVKRVSHAEDKASRTTRLMYGLQQQVREIKADLIKLGAEGLHGKKKTLIIVKLGAAHRAFLRAVQAFVYNLSDHDIKFGLPRVNKDINFINEQMTELCIELGIGGHSGIPVGVVNLIKREDNYERWARDKALPNRTRKPQNERFKPVKETVIIGRSHSPPRSSRSDKDHHSARLCQGQTSVHNEPTPERQETIRSGINALLRARDRSSSPPLSPTRKGNKPRGLLLAEKLKKEKVRIAIPEVTDLNDDYGYLEPTYSSQQKTRDLHEIHRPESPKSPRKDLTPRSMRGLSPRREYGISPRYGRSPRVGVSPRRDVDGYLTHLDVGVPREWVADAERAIKSQLKPLLDQAKEISGKTRDPFSLRNKLSEKTSEKVEVNADILGDMLLHDLMRDTASELQRMEDDEKSERLATEMRNAPQVEGLLQRLNEMEREQNAIRQKWNSINYQDEEKSLTERAKDLSSFGKKPVTPQPIHITTGSGSSRNAYQPVIRTDVEGGIELSRPSASLTQQRSHDEFDDVINEPMHLLIPPLIPFTIHKETLDSIFEYRNEYEQFLKRSANVSAGGFNPSNIMATIADEILGDCMESITQEIFDSGSAATVEKVFRSEFVCPKTDKVAATQQQKPHDVTRDEDENFEDEDDIVGTEYSETDFDDDEDDDDNYEDARDFDQ
ncbi:protein moonraker-like [Tubulanus polymorphus]|uniref:protein moonraker-like n=1 Tax=Tubulanus polymorphus TaxID=672921 RepID=UPI003DA6CC0C